jgi:hypothetical protein
MLVLVDVPPGSRQLEGEIVGVEMGLKRGDVVEVVRIRHHLLARLYGGQHEAGLSGDRIDGVSGTNLLGPRNEGRLNQIVLRRELAEASLHAS